VAKNPSNENLPFIEIFLLKYILIEILIVLLVVMMQIVQRHFYPDCHANKL